MPATADRWTDSPARFSAAITAALWGIGGTLISSGGKVAATFLDAVDDICGVRPDATGLDFGGRLDPEIAELLVQVARRRSEQVLAVLARFQELIAARAGSRPVQPRRAGRVANRLVRRHVVKAASPRAGQLAIKVARWAKRSRQASTCR